MYIRLHVTACHTKAYSTRLGGYPDSACCSGLSSHMDSSIVSNREDQVLTWQTWRQKEQHNHSMRHCGHSLPNASLHAAGREYKVQNHYVATRYNPKE